MFIFHSPRVIVAVSSLFSVTLLPYLTISEECRCHSQLVKWWKVNFSILMRGRYIMKL